MAIKNFEFSGNRYKQRLFDDIKSQLSYFDKTQRLQALNFFEIRFENTTGSKQTIRIFDSRESSEAQEITYNETVIDDDFSDSSVWTESGAANIDGGKLKFEADTTSVSIDKNDWTVNDNNTSGAGITIFDNFPNLSIVSRINGGMGYANLEVQINHGGAGGFIDIAGNWTHETGAIGSTIEIRDGGSTGTILFQKTNGDDGTGNIGISGESVSTNILWIKCEVSNGASVDDAEANLSISAISVYNYTGDIQRTDKTFTAGDELSISIDIDTTNSTFLKLTLGGDLIDLTGQTGTYETTHTITTGGDLIKIENQSEASQLDDLNITVTKTSTLIDNTEELTDYDYKLSSLHYNPILIHSLKIIVNTLDQVSQNIFTFKGNTISGNAYEDTINLDHYLSAENSAQIVVDIDFPEPIVFSKNDFFQTVLNSNENMSILFFYEQTSNLELLKDSNNIKLALQRFYD